MHVSKGKHRGGANNSSSRSARGPPPATEQFPELHEDATEPPPYNSRAQCSTPPVFTIGSDEPDEPVPQVLDTEQYYHPASFPGYTVVQVIQGGERQALLSRARRQQPRRSCLGRCCGALCTCVCFLVGVGVVAALLCGAFFAYRQVAGDWRCRGLLPYSDQRFAYDSRLVIESGVTLTDVHLVGDSGVRAVIEASPGRRVGVEHMDGVLRIHGSSPGSWWWQGSGCVRATLYVGRPGNSSEVKSLEVTASSGSLTALDVGEYAVDRVKVTMRNGRVHLRDLDVRGSLHVSMSNGQINASNVRVGKALELRASNSPLDLANVTASSAITVQATNAHINAQSLRSPYATLRTSNGRVSLGDVDVGDNLLVHTSNGKIEGDARAGLFYARTSNAAVRLELGGRLRVVAVDSSNGAIDVVAGGFSGMFDVNTSNSRVSVTGTGLIEFMESGVAHKRGVYGERGNGNITLDTRNGRVDLRFY
ncbi:hypothetical protein GGI10_000681 [Coemansia sp. RSA 2530]|nr:hypothetical protein GGI10_000681 [Coemansia sp. RSA 2530]